MQLNEMMVAMRIEIQDTAKTIWKDDDLTRAVQKTVSMLSRFIPKRSVVETVLDRDISGETLTIASNTGTLTYKPVKVGTLAIPSKEEGTNFKVNLLTGVVDEITGLADTDYTVAYDLDSRLLDISTLLPEENYIKIERVEYPAGSNPPTYPVFEIFGEFLLIKGVNDLVSNEHLRIIYLKPWTPPTAIADGDYPEHLDNPIIIGASGQALIFMAEKYVQQSLTELALVNAAADSMATPLADINTALDKITTEVGYADTALDKVATYLESNGTTDNAKDVLANITDEAAELRTCIVALLDKSGTYLMSADTPPSAHDYLVDGDDFINTSNAGQDVAENHVKYAEASINLFSGLIKDAETRLSMLRSYIEEAQGWMKMGDTFIAEGAQRLNSVQAYLGEAQQRVAEVSAWALQADKYTTTSREYLNIAGRFLASGQSKINEFLISIGVKPEFYSYKGSSEQFANS